MIGTLAVIVGVVEGATLKQSPLIVCHTLAEKRIESRR